MPSKIDTGVTGGAPNLLGSFTAAARPLPENADWQAHGLSHTPENCGTPWVWQNCSHVADAQDCVNGVVTLTFVESEAPNGQWTVTVDPAGEAADTTALLDRDVDAAELLAAIEALNNVSPGDFSIVGNNALGWGFESFTITAEADGGFECTDLTGVFTMDCSDLPQECINPQHWQILTVDGGSIDTETAQITLTFDPTGADPHTTALIPLPDDNPANLATATAAIEALPNVDPGDFILTQASTESYLITADPDGQYACTDIGDAWSVDCSTIVPTPPEAVVECEVITVEPGQPEITVTCSVEADPAGQAAVTEITKPLLSAADAASFLPFLVEYNAQSCAGIPGDWDQLAGRAERGLRARISQGIARALSSTAPDGLPNVNPNLPDIATDVSPADPGGLACSLSALIEDAYACGASGELWIHAPAWLLPHFLQDTAIVQVGSVWKLGPHTVVLDQGYTNEAPVGSPDAAAGEAWIYVTGPFEYAIGPVQQLDDTTRGISPRLNQANVIAAQLAIYRFDPCCVFATLVEVGRCGAAVPPIPFIESTSSPACERFTVTGRRFSLVNHLRLGGGIEVNYYDPAGPDAGLNPGTATINAWTDTFIDITDTALPGAGNPFTFIRTFTLGDVDTELHLLDPDLIIEGCE